MHYKQPDSVSNEEIFICQKCGDCCKGYGGTFVTKKDIIRIADYIGAERDTFVDKYCAVSGNRPVLAQAENGFCIFWDNLCTIHPVKPKMCKKWPFLESVLTDISNWHIMAGSCPGIKTDTPNNIVRECITQYSNS
jgi:uncharacterized protein